MQKLWTIAVLISLAAGFAAADDNNIVITSQPLLTAQVGVLYQYQVIATSDPPGAMITFNLHEAPAGMTIDSQTGLIEWTPTQVGAFRVEVRAEVQHDSPNDGGGRAEQRYTLRVLSGSPAVVHGTLRNLQGVGVGNVRIRMFEISSAHFLFIGMSDSSGVYSIEGVNPGTYFLRASPERNSIYAEQWFDGVRRIQDATPVDVPESSTVTVNFTLFPRDSNRVFTLSGNVSDTNGAPIARASVAIFRAREHDDLDGSGFNFRGLDDRDRDQHLVTIVLTDSMGNYSTRLRSRSYILAARNAGFVTQFWDHKDNLLDADRLRLVRDTSGINFNLTPTPAANGTITGQVTARTTSVPLEAHVLGFHRLTPNGRFTGFVRHAETDSLGMYTLSHVRSGFYVVLAVPEDDFLPTFYDTTGGTTILSQAFPVPVNNSLVSDINIMAFPDTVSGMNRVQGIVSSGTAGVAGTLLFARSVPTNDVVGASVSEASGAYRIVGLAPGTYEIAAAKPGFEPVTGAAFNIQYTGNMPSTAVQNISLISTPTDAGTPAGIPGEFKLEQNYPNPFNPATTITFQLFNTAFVSLKVFDVLGREVATLVNEVRPAGSYDVKFDASGLASGVYLYRLSAGNLHETKKLLLLR